MTASELVTRYMVTMGWSSEDILDVILGHMRAEEVEHFVSVLDSVAEQMLETWSG